MALTRLTTCTKSFEANLIKALLEDNEIECFINNEMINTVLPYLGFSMESGINIMVDETNLEKALELLEENKDLADSDE